MRQFCAIVSGPGGPQRSNGVYLCYSPRFLAYRVMIDLDHNAGAPLHPDVRDAMAALLGREDLGNPSSLHRAGQAARAVVERARHRVAAAVGAEPLEVTFTSGGTESDALGILGVARARRRAGKTYGIVSSPIEHPAVLGAVKRLQAEGYPLTMVVPDALGRIDGDALRTALAQSAPVGLVTLAAANHELGTAYPMTELSEVVRQQAPEAVIHVDAVQALGRVAVSRSAWGTDALSISSHKIHGPRGVGALVHDKALSIDSLVGEGHQERGRRPGTESVLLIHGFGLAAELAAAQLQGVSTHMRGLHARLRDGLTAMGGRVHGDPVRHVGNTITVAFDDVDGHLLMISLDLEGIAVSTGAACDAGAGEPSAVLRALGQEADARASIRLSVSLRTTDADIDTVLAKLPGIVARVRRARAS